MKKMLVVALALVVSTMGSVQAQKVNEAAIAKKLEKIELEKQDAKKNTKASFWLGAGASYYEAGTAISGMLYTGMDQISAELLLGVNKNPQTESVNGTEYTLLVYPYMNTYFAADSTLSFWKITKPMWGTALESSAEAYIKALSLDQSKTTVEKATAGLNLIVDAYKQQAGNYYSMREMKGAAGAFAMAYDLGKEPALNKIDTTAGYNAGLLSTVTGDFVMAEKYLREMIALDYAQEGDVYYYLFHSINGQQRVDDAKAVLLDAIAVYPKNTKVLEALLGLYATTGEDPNAIIPIVEAAIEEDPTNAELYAGLGRIYDKLGNVDKSVEVFRKAVEVSPEDFGTNFNLGLMILKAADAKATELRDKPITSQEEFNADLAVVNNAYAEALPYLEKSHEVNPTDAATIELLKNVYFRLRDEAPAMMDNYNKYNDLFKSL